MLNTFARNAFIGCLLLLSAGAAIAAPSLATSTTQTVAFTAAVPVSTLAFATPAAPSRLMVVTLNMNIAASTGTTGLSVYYGDKVLTFGTGISGPGPTVRTEVFYLLSPAVGTQTIRVQLQNVTATVNTLIGVSVFQDVDQLNPATAATTSSNTGTAVTSTIASQATDLVVDFVTARNNGGPTTITVAGGQSTIYNGQTATGNTQVVAAATTKPGAATVTMAYTLSNSRDWSKITSSLHAATTDISVTGYGDPDVVTTLPTTVKLVYRIKTNTGGAGGINFTVPLPAGLTIVSATASQGSCVAGATSTCNIGTLNSDGDYATVTITATTGTALAGTAYAITGTATTTTTETTPANNAATVTVQTEGHLCANPGRDGAAGTVTTSVNTYYPGSSAAVAAGATSLNVGAVPAGYGASAIGVGDLLLIMQMQDAAIDTRDDDRYGDGSGLGGTAAPGTGSSALNSSGRFEYVIATSAVPVTGGTINFTASGVGGGLLYSYSSAAYGANGQKTYQVIRVPQYITATLAAGSMPPVWNGAVGGVFAMDASGTVTMGSNAGAGTVATTNGSQTVTGTGTTFLTQIHSGDTININGQGNYVVLFVQDNVTLYLTTNATATAAGRTYTVPQVSVSGIGFRGGAGRGLLNDPAGGLNTAYRTLSTINANAQKGEGVSGTPAYVFNNTATAQNTGVEGYVNGSSGRGAPGNAGGGGTAGNPTVNDQNAGGGGGANGGNGGVGGNAWNSAAPSGGFGGQFEAPSATRVILGGGGGAGTTNNSTAAGAVSLATNGINSSGAPGGGIVIIRANAVTGAGTISANGANALDILNDAGGGGGAGGSIVIQIQSGNLTTVTATAKGGNGGNAWLAQGNPAAPDDYPGERHGPGGGGGGGAIYLTSAAAAMDLSGGTNGLTTTANANFGASPGLPGISAIPFSILPGADSTYSCFADLAVTDSGTPNPVSPGGNITYTQVVTNNGPGRAENVVFSQAIPASTTYQSIVIPAGWTCPTLPAVGSSGGNIVCTRPALASGGSSSFTVVVQAHPGTPVGYIVSDTVTVSSSTEDPNLSNNQATATTNVTGPLVADMAVTVTGPPTVIQGAALASPLTVSNGGGATAAAAKLTVAVPANSTFVSMTTPAGWTCTAPIAGVVTCTPSGGTLASGGSANFTMNLTASGASGSTVTITPTVSTTTAESTTANNTATASTVIRATNTADIGVTVTPSATQTEVGDVVQFLETVTNNGPTATNATVVTHTVPANTTFVSITPPAGWTCTPPAVGAPAGTAIPCSTTGTLASGASTQFITKFLVNNGVAAGTNITDTVSVNPVSLPAGVTDSDPSNNSASGVSVVRAANTADLAIVKTDSPDPIGQGQLVTYTLTVTNNGPELGTGVTVADALPVASVDYISAQPSQGTCTFTTPNLSCALGSLAVGGTATVSVIVQVKAAVAGGTVISNTATVSGTKTDPVAANNSSTTTTTVLAVTLVRLRDFQVKQKNDKVTISWETSFEQDNLGFNVYREVGGVRTKVNNSLIAGTALLSRDHDRIAGHNYRYNDELTSGTFAQYYLEDVDLKGVHTMHGPESPTVERAAAAFADQSAGAAANSATPLSGLGAGGNFIASPAGQGVIRDKTLGVPTRQQTNQQFDLAKQGGLKIYVSVEGWYRITRAAMAAAGYDPSEDPDNLALYTAGVEQPILVNSGGDGKLDPNDSIEFYGTPLDTISTGARTYWLRSNQNNQGGGNQGNSGHRIQLSKIRGGDPVTGAVPFTSQREERSIFFAALINNGEASSFFGPVITSTPGTQPLTVGALDPAYGGNASLEVKLQGATDQLTHAVSVAINGHRLGTATFINQQLKTANYTFPQSWLQSGSNTLTLGSLNGDDDVSLGSGAKLTYQHLLRADNGAFEATLPGGRTVTISGFTTTGVRALDVTDVANPIELETTVAADPQGGFKATFTPAGFAPRVVLAFQPSRVLTPNELAAAKPSSWNEAKKGTDLLIITNSAFTAAATSLKTLRERGGITTTVIDVEELYNEFNFGVRSPEAIRSFIQTALKSKTPPKYVLLVGDASIDPRNYLQLGAFDYLPTKLVSTTMIKTASDDWFADFDGDGIADIAIGRIPVRTANEANVVFNKILSRGTPSGPWANSVLLLADRPTDYDFAAVAASLKRLVPAPLTTRTVDYATSSSPSSDTIGALNDGALIADYIGHASVEIWGERVFASSNASALVNGNRLPFVVAMDCLNGYFHDLYTESLAEALLKAPNGGAVAVWASSTLSQPDTQATMNRELFRILFANPTISLGDAVRRAKAATSDLDLRRSWILFGDPSMRLR